MSLESNGSSFDLYVCLNTKKAVEENGFVKEVRLNQSTANCSLEAEKAAFIELMTKFANSKDFEHAIYDLQSTFNLSVKHSINLSMPN